MAVLSYIKNGCFGVLMLLHIVLKGQDIVFEINKKELSLEEKFFLSVSVKQKQVDKPIVFPEIEGITRDQLFTRPLNNEGEVYIQTYIPDKAGQLLIPSFCVWVAGKKYNSPVFLLNIKKGIGGKGERNYTPTNFEPKLVLECSDYQAYIGQQINTQIALYVPENQQGNYEIPQQSVYDIQKKGRVEACWTEVIPLDRPTSKDTVINGKKYIRHLLYQAFIFPLDTGILKWEKAFLRLKHKYLSDDTPNAKDMQSPRIVFRWDTVAMESAEIKVKALPPTTLLNANSLGEWTMSAEISEKEFFTGDAITLKVAIQGRGNVALIPKPIIQVPKQFMGDEPLTTMMIQRDSLGVSGTKHFVFKWFPTQAGHFELGPIVLYYFDPSTQQYDSLRSEIYRLHITGEDKSSQLTGSDRENFYQKAFSKAAERHQVMLPYTQYWVILLIAFTIISLFWVWKNTV